MRSSPIGPRNGYGACSRPLYRPSTAAKNADKAADARENRVAAIQPTPEVHWYDPPVLLASEPTVEEPRKAAPKTDQKTETPVCTFGPVEKFILLGVFALCAGTLVWLIFSVITFNMR